LLTLTATAHHQSEESPYACWQPRELQSYLQEHCNCASLISLVIKMSKKENENLKNDGCNQDLGSESPKKDERRDEDAQKDQLHAVGNFPTNALILNLKKIFF